MLGISLGWGLQLEGHYINFGSVLHYDVLLVCHNAHHMQHT